MAAPYRHAVARVTAGVLLCAACQRPQPPTQGTAQVARQVAPPATVAAISTAPTATQPAVLIAELPDDGTLDRRGQFGGTRGAHSKSIGTAQHGRLEGGVPLQDSPNLLILPQTRRNALFFGTAELVALLQRSALAVALDWPGSVLRVGNVARQTGGDIGPSVSHNSGRDADVLFFAHDRLGTGQGPPNFCHFDDQGVADGPPADAGRYEFDAERNWALVRHWLTDPDVVVQWIFVAAPLRNQLLDVALRRAAPASLRLRAARVLVQPRDSSPHADHFHLRIGCPPGDRPECLDGGVATARARDAQIDALLQMYHHGSPAEQRYARELLSLPPGADVAALPPIEGVD